MKANRELVTTFARNLWQAKMRGNTLVEPLGVTWHATNACNFRCDYCDEGKGNMYPDLKGYTMRTDEAKHVLGLARDKVSLLYITGGEPFVRKDLSEMCRWAKQDARYHYIGLNTNGVLIHRQEAVLDHIDELVISLDSTDEERYDRILNCGTGTARAIKDSIRRYALLRNRYEHRLTVSCVIMPDLLSHARDVMKFCFENHVHFSAIPQSVGPYPHPKLRDNQEYRDLIDEIVAEKKRGNPVWGSETYFRTIRDFVKFQCYPTTAPRIFPNGDLMYPCSPLGKVAGNLIGAKTFDEIYRAGIDEHGGIPDCDARCFASCYIETSSTMNLPASIIWEHFVSWNRDRRPRQRDEAEPLKICPTKEALLPALRDRDASGGDKLVQIRGVVPPAAGTE